jgi:hypothetical protein
MVGCQKQTQAKPPISAVKCNSIFQEFETAFAKRSRNSLLITRLGKANEVDVSTLFITTYTVAVSTVADCLRN